MTILIPTDDYAALVEAAEHWKNEGVVDEYDEPEPILEHHFVPYWPWEGLNSICGHNGCGASRANPVHFA